MKRLVFLVEGDTEIIFVEKHIIPFLYSKSFQNPMNAQKIVTNRKLNKKGGNVSYAYLKNDLTRVLSQGDVIVTTLLDFFRLPTNFPGYSSDVSRISEIEKSISNDFGGDKRIIPYIQKHELEALMFSSMEGFEIVVDDQRELTILAAVIAQYADPEDINSSPQGAPSKRLDEIFGYDKIADGELILEAIGIEAMIEKCPRFSNWMEKLIEELSL